MRKSILTAGLLLLPLAAHAALRVVTVSEDLAYLARRVGGDAVQVHSLSSGDQDIHMVEPRPSMVMKVKRADFFVRTGLDLDMWADSLLAAARNKKVSYGAPGYVDASVGLKLLQVPEGKIDGSMGDIHIFGNPHYWLDPANAKTMAKNIAAGLCRVKPDGCAAFKTNKAAFDEELEGRLREWSARLAPFKGASIVTYHNSWVYFAERFGLEIIGNIEPKPGIPPTPSHLRELIDTMKARKAKVIMAESFFPRQGPESVAMKTGAAVLEVPSSTGGIPGIESYFDLFDFVTKELAERL